MPDAAPIKPVRVSKMKEPVRRSSRLAEKPQLPALEKALRVLNAKMGIVVPEEPKMPLGQAWREFVKSFKTALPDAAIQALIALFRFHLPSMIDADEALIAMAGPRGCDLAARDEVVASA